MSGSWSGRKTHVVVTVVRRQQDYDAPNWTPQHRPGIVISIRSDKGTEVVREYLRRAYTNVDISLIYEVTGMPNHRDYHFRVWN